MHKVHTNEIPLRQDCLATSWRNHTPKGMFEAAQGYAHVEFGGVELCKVLYNAQKLRRLYLQKT